jgi:mannosyltransferase
MVSDTEAPPPVTMPPAVRAAEADRRRAVPWDVAAVAGPAALAVALCVFELTTRSLWLDEAATVAIASQHGSALWTAIAHDGGNMLGYYALLHVLIGWFGDGSLVLRLPSVVAAAAGAGAVSLLALRLFDRRAAIASGLLTAVSLPLVFWGQDARGYAPMVALVAGSFVAFASIVTAGGGRRGRGPWIAYVLLTTLSVYASFVAILAVPAQLLVLVVRRHGWRRVASALVACAMFWIPLAVMAASRGANQLFWIPRPSLTSEKEVVLALTSAGFEPNFRLAGVATFLAIVSVVLLVGAAATIIVRLARGAGRERPWGALLALSWLVVPVGLMWLESLVGQPLFTARNALVSLPAVALLLGWVITQTRVRIRLAWLAVAALLALRALVLAPSYGTSPEDWRATTAYVLDASRPGDCIAFYPLDGRMAFGYYVGAGRAAGTPRSVWPALPWSTVRPYVEQYATPSASALTSRCTRLWLVASHQGLPDGTAGSRAHYARYVALRSTLAREYGRRRTISFGYASVIWVDVFGR